MRLKQGLEFHNGKTVTADDVLFSIARLLDPKSGATAAAQLGAIDLKRSKKVDDRTVKFVLKTPHVVLRRDAERHRLHHPGRLQPEEAGQHGAVEVRQLQARPADRARAVRELLGAQAASSTSSCSSELPDDTARVNALLSGQVDAINQVPFAQVPVLKGETATCRSSSRRPARGTRSRCGSTRPPSTTCACARRSASRWIASRRCRRRSSARACRPPTTTAASIRRQRRASSARQNIEQAKSLLKAAGQQNLKVELVTSPISAGIVEACQVLAQNAKAAGIEISLRKVDVSTYFGGYGKWPFAVDYWVGLPYLVDGLAQRRPGSERRQHDALQRSRVQQALQRGRQDDRRRPSGARSSSACRRSSSSAAAT